MNKFAANVSAIYGEKGKQWLQNLPSITKKIAKLWKLSDLKILKDLSYNYVLQGMQGSKPIVLKIGIDHGALNQEARVLKILQNFGAVELLDFQPGILLLEKVLDGKPIKSCKIKNKTAIFCDLAKKIFQAKIDKNSNFPSVNKQLKIIDRNCDSIPVEYLILAKKLKDKLLTLPSQEATLLHGDLHNLNVLRSGNSWKVIDPKGVIGQKVNEVWTFVIDFEKDTKFIADYFNWDIYLVREWYFVQLVMATLWRIEDNLSPKLFLNILKKVYHYY